MAVSNQLGQRESASAPTLVLTPSKLRDYLLCPLAYKLKSAVRRAGSETTPSLAFGTSLHRALEEVHRKPTSEGRPEQADAILHRCWEADGYIDEREAAGYFMRGAHALRRYMETVGREVGEVLGTELYLSRLVRMSGTQVRFGCKVDRLDRRADGALEVLDYKTAISGRVPTEAALAADLPTFIYYALVRFSHPECACVFVSQLNVLTLAKVTVGYSRTELDANKSTLRKVVSEIVAGNFDPRPSGDCAWCAVKDRCPVFNAEADIDELT
jgi:putative RecB family exonuclease